MPTETQMYSDALQDIVSLLDDYCPDDDNALSYEELFLSVAALARDGIEAGERESYANK